MSTAGTVNHHIETLISRMTLDQKVGCLMTLGLSGTLITPLVRSAIFEYHCSGFRCTPRIRRFGSYIDPKSNKEIVRIADITGYKNDSGIGCPTMTASQYNELLCKLQDLAQTRPCSVPLHFSLDQEGGGTGEMYFPGANHFPSPMGMAASGDPGFVYQIALANARQLRATGITWSHTPVLDVNVHPDNPEIGTRAFGDSTDRLIEYALAWCRGMKEGGIVTTGKHFPGRGDSAMDAHYEIPRIDTNKKQMMERDLRPYAELIKANVLPTVMLAHGIYTAIDPDNVSTVSKKVVTGLLREELGYEGVITTDSMTMAGIATRYGVPEACAMSLEAGSDIVLMKADNMMIADTFNAIKGFVESKKISEKDLDDKVRRVLTMKHEYGLFFFGSAPEKKPEEVFAEPRIKEIASRAAHRCQIVARDRKKLLPLPTDAPVLVIEQLQAFPNTIENHWGMVYRACLERNPQTRYLEIGSVADESDAKRIRETAELFDTIVVCNMFNRGSRPNTDILRETLFSLKGKKIVLITNHPYPMTIPKEADTVVVTFSYTNYQCEAAAKLLFGEISAEGVWPIDYQLPA